ncbi:MAG: hypothetical protein AAFV29_03895, partial [Myxococcota bacterium]
LSRARKTLKAEMSRLRSSGFVASPDLIKKWEAATDPHGRARALAAERAASQNGEQSVAPTNKTND